MEKLLWKFNIPTYCLHRSSGSLYLTSTIVITLQKHNQLIQDVIDEPTIHNEFEFQSTTEQSFDQCNIINTHPLNININPLHIPMNITEELKEWSLTCNVNHLTINNLLSRLKKHECFKTIPIDARTLLCTPRQTVTKVIEPGLYYHFGLLNGILQFLSSHQKFCIDNEVINLKFHVDGLPISKSSPSQLWPILGSVIKHKFIFIIGLYHSFVAKPNNAYEFLIEFSEEAKIVKNEIIFDGKHFQCNIVTFIADAPAKAFCLQIKNHTGYFSCTKCKVEGEYISNRMCFADIDAPVCTHIEFIQHADDKYQTGITPLTLIPNFNFVDSIPVEYMHLINLGLVKKMLYLWLRGPLTVRIKFSTVQKISKVLVEDIRSRTPTEFQRKPRSLLHYCNWKAVELKMFLLYTGVVVLKNCLRTDVYNHFVTLHLAISLLCRTNITNQSIDYVENLLRHFVKSFEVIYSRTFMSHNVHSLIHLAEDVRKNNRSLDEFSAFKFENYMQKFHKLLRKDEKPLQQLIKRYTELSSSFMINTKSCCDTSSYPKIIKYKSNKIEKIQFEHFSICPDNINDQFCALENGAIVKVKTIVEKNDKYFITGNYFLNSSDLYIVPCQSSKLGIFSIITLSQSMSIWPIKKIYSKIFLIPIPGKNDEYSAFPML